MTPPSATAVRGGNGGVAVKAACLVVEMLVLPFVMLGNFCWFRRAYGGHWEHWWIGSPVNGAIWLHDVRRGERPGLGETCFAREDHGSTP